MLKLLLKKLWRFRIYDTAVCWIYAPARMDTGILQIYELFCGHKSVPVRLGLPVAAKNKFLTNKRPFTKIKK